MVQAFGVYLNFSAQIFHDKIKLQTELKLEELITDFLRELRMYVNRTKDDERAELHTIYVQSLSQSDKLVTRIVGHLPHGRRDLASWMQRFFKRRTGENFTPDVIGFDLASDKDALRGHLTLIRSICAEVLPDDPACLTFLRRTQIDVRQNVWQASGKSPRLSRLIDAAAQRQAADDLDVLSVFDNDRADPCSGWEVREFEYRAALVRDRARLEQAAQERADGGLARAAVREQWVQTKRVREALRPGFNK